MKLPKSVKIAATDIFIEKWDGRRAVAEASFGEYSSLEGKIRIDTSAPSPYTVLDTLLHEITHAIYDIYNISGKDDEEKTVTMIATGWTQVFRDNPVVLAYINDICCT